MYYIYIYLAVTMSYVLTTFTNCDKEGLIYDYIQSENETMSNNCIKKNNKSQLSQRLCDLVQQPYIKVINTDEKTKEIITRNNNPNDNKIMTEYAHESLCKVLVSSVNCDVDLKIVITPENIIFQNNKNENVIELKYTEICVNQSDNILEISSNNCLLVIQTEDAFSLHQQIMHFIYSYVEASLHPHVEETQIKPEVIKELPKDAVYEVFTKCSCGKDIKLYCDKCNKSIDDICGYKSFKINCPKCNSECNVFQMENSEKTYGNCKKCLEDLSKVSINDISSIVYIIIIRNV